MCMLNCFIQVNYCMFTCAASHLKKVLCLKAHSVTASYSVRVLHAYIQAWGKNVKWLRVVNERHLKYVKVRACGKSV